MIAHAVHFRLLLFLSHQQVEELVAILVKSQGYLALSGSFIWFRIRSTRLIQEVHEALDEKENIYQRM